MDAPLSRSPGAPACRHPDAFEPADPESRVPRWLGTARDAPYWAISAALHLILLLSVGAYVMYVPPPTLEEHRLIVRRPFEPPLPRPEEKPGLEDVPRILADVDKRRPVLQLMPQQPTLIPKGLEENLADKALMGHHAVDGYGLGGGPAGPYGNRRGEGRKNNPGGSPGTEKALRRALDWLVRHQSPDGSWRARGFTAQCDKRKGVCANRAKGHGDGRGFATHDVGITALALLAFTGDGNTHVFAKRPEYVETVRKAMKWLLKEQVRAGDPDDRGRFGWPDVKIHGWKADAGADPYKATMDEQWIYDHALATMAMAELLVLTGDTIGLQRPVSLAAELCLRAQNDGYGWRYGIKPGENDTSVTGWMILALKACEAAELPRPAPARYGKSFRDALEWVRRATSVSTGITGYKAPGDEGSRLNGIYPEPYPFSKELSCMTAVAVLCRLFAGEKRTDSMIKKGVAVLVRNPPVWRERAAKRLSRVNFYYWYYGTYALFQYGGVPWRDWNGRMMKVLLDSQRVGGCEHGSWDPIGEWGAAGGRVYTTALGAMTLEVYYRYARAREKPIRDSRGLKDGPRGRRASTGG